jgi:arsenate reductase
MSESFASPRVQDGNPVRAPYNVLFLCVANSARSLIAESILNMIGGGRFRAYSAGSHPSGKVHPQAAALLRHEGFEIGSLRSKSWNEFVRVGAPAMDFAITVCEPRETCPSWPGQPIHAHWDMSDPALVQTSPEDIVEAFAQSYRLLSGRLSDFVNLNMAGLSRLALHQLVQDIAPKA